MKIIQGDLISLAKDGTFDLIIHGCNCFHTMGAGIAKQIKKAFPGAYEADLKTKFGDLNKLGEYSFWKDEQTGLVVINAYTQFEPGPRFEYLALDAFLVNLMCDFDLNKSKIGFPKLGAGIGGGDWNVIKNIFDKWLFDYDYTLVEWVQPKDKI